MSNTAKTMEIAGEVLRKFFTEKIEREWVPLTSTQAQELFGKTEQLEAEIKRLQELADYRLKLLTKMPSEWVGLTDEDIAELRCHGAHSLSDADFRAIEAKLKEKHEWKRDPRDMCGNE